MRSVPFVPSKRTTSGGQAGNQPTNVLLLQTTSVQRSLEARNSQAPKRNLSPQRAQKCQTPLTQLRNDTQLRRESAQQQSAVARSQTGGQRRRNIATTVSAKTQPIPATGTQACQTPLNQLRNDTELQRWSSHQPAGEHRKQQPAGSQLLPTTTVAHTSNTETTERTPTRNRCNRGTIDSDARRMPLHRPKLQEHEQSTNPQPSRCTVNHTPHSLLHSDTSTSNARPKHDAPAHREASRSGNTEDRD